MLQNWSFSSSWQLDLQQHLFDTWAVSAQNQISVMVFTCHMCIDMVASCNLQDAAVWFQAEHQSLCCHLCSDGWGFSCEQSMSLIIRVEAPMLRLFLFTNHLSSRFLAGERHRQTCVFIHMGMRLQLVASWFLSLAAAEIDLFIPHHLERWSVICFLVLAWPSGAFVCFVGLSSLFLSMQWSVGTECYDCATQHEKKRPLREWQLSICKYHHIHSFRGSVIRTLLSNFRGEKSTHLCKVTTPHPLWKPNQIKRNRKPRVQRLQWHIQVHTSRIPKPFCQTCRTLQNSGTRLDSL